MSDHADKKPEAKADMTWHAVDEEHLEDQEKILAGRHDVNYPAVLTKDVQGG